MFASIQPSATSQWECIPRQSKEGPRSVKQILEALGATAVTWQRLVPSTVEMARSNTLSSRHGLGAFPAHTDFATAATPPQYLILVAPRSREAETLIFDPFELLQEFGLDHVQRSLFLLKGRYASYCRILTIRNGELFFRYNSAVMTARNDEAVAVAAYIAKMKPIRRVDWKNTRILILNNWSTFHGRNQLPEAQDVGLYRFAAWRDQ